MPNNELTLSDSVDYGYDISYDPAWMAITITGWYEQYEKWPNQTMHLGKFLTTLGITAEYCQKAFGEGDVETMRCFYCNDPLRADEVKTYHDKHTCNVCHYLLVDYAKSTAPEVTDGN